MNSKTIALGALAIMVVTGCAAKQKIVNAVGGAKLVGNQIEVDEHVKFASGEATILEESFELLNSVAQILSMNPGIAAVQVEGHTDSTGDAAFNQDLSERRATSVMEYLKSKGVSKSITAQGFGPDQPLCQDDTQECHARNRRVEFIVKKDS